jgi:dihydrofolate reductase
MTRTQYYTASSLDGFIADPDHSLEWLLQFGDPGPGYQEFIREVGAIVMGSTTYEWILRQLGSAIAPAWPYEQPAWVFTSRSPAVAPGADIRFVRGDVRPVHEETTAAAGGRNIWIVGGGELAGQFHDHGLLDELIVHVAPVTLGAGSPLLPREITNPPLRLVSASATGAFVEMRYRIRRSQ